MVVLQLGEMAGKPITTVQDNNMTYVMKLLETWSFPHPNKWLFLPKPNQALLQQHTTVYFT